MNNWVSVQKKMPEHLQTVWLASKDKKWVALGCLVEEEYEESTSFGYHWAISNGCIYAENGKIVSECESDDLDVQYWHELPTLDFEYEK